MIKKKENRVSQVTNFLKKSGDRFFKRKIGGENCGGNEEGIT